MLLDRWWLDGGTLSIITWVRSHFLTPSMVRSLTLSLTPGWVKSLTLSLTPGPRSRAWHRGWHSTWSWLAVVTVTCRAGVRCSVSRPGASRVRGESAALAPDNNTPPRLDTHADKEVQVNRRCESLSSGSGAWRMKAVMAIRWHKSCWRHVAPCRCGAGVGVSRCPHRSRCRRVFTVLVSPSSEHSSLHQPLCRSDLETICRYIWTLLLCCSGRVKLTAVYCSTTCWHLTPDLL